jgi:hypothetical protein
MPRSTSIEWMRTPAAGATGDVIAGVAAICPRTVVDCTRVLCARRTSDAVLRRAWPHLDGIFTVIPPAAGHSVGLVTGEPLATIAGCVSRRTNADQSRLFEQRRSRHVEAKRNCGLTVRPGQRGECEPLRGPCYVVAPRAASRGHCRWRAQFTGTPTERSSGLTWVEPTIAANPPTSLSRVAVIRTSRLWLTADTWFIAFGTPKLSVLRPTQSDLLPVGQCRLAVRCVRMRNGSCSTRHG